MEPTSLNPPRTTFNGLRAAVATQYPRATPPAFSLAEAGIVGSGLGGLDAALGGGFPRGAITTLEGTPGSGRSAVAARLLATATADGGLGALIELPQGSEGAVYPPALAAAGVDLDRLLIVHPEDPSGIAGAVDIVLRSAAFGVVVMPAIALPTATWTRLGSLAHRANAVLITLGAQASHELRYFAALRIRLTTTGVCFAGAGGLFGTLAGTSIQAEILKHKRAVPGKHARFTCTMFESGPLPLTELRTRELSRPGLPRSALG